jgi:hypothetical protein
MMTCHKYVNTWPLNRSARVLSDIALTDKAATLPTSVSAVSVGGFEIIAAKHREHAAASLLAQQSLHRPQRG